jgi:hypothetical protein
MMGTTKLIKGLPQPRLATPRPKLQATKGTAPLNPFGANKMKIKTASLSDFRHMQQMQKMAAYDPMAHALLALREEQEKEAGVAAGLNLTAKALGGAGKLFKSKWLTGLAGRAATGAQARYGAAATRTLNRAAASENVGVQAVNRGARDSYAQRAAGQLDQAVKLEDRAAAAGRFSDAMKSQQTALAAPKADPGTVGGSFRGALLKGGLIGGTGLVAGGAAVGGVQGAQAQNALAQGMSYNQGIR